MADGFARVRKTVALLDADPDLGNGLDDRELAAARQRAVAAVMEIEGPGWGPTAIRGAAQDGWLGLLLLKGLMIRKRPRRRALGQGEGAGDPGGQVGDPRRRNPAQGHSPLAREGQARARRPLRRLPTQQTTLPRLPHRPGQRVADRDRRDRGRLSPFGQGPPRYHRRALGAARRRGRPQATRDPLQRRLRRLLALPPRPRTTSRPRIPVRPRDHPAASMRSLQKTRTQLISGFPAQDTA